MKKFIKILIAAVLTIALIYGGCKLLDFMTVDDTKTYSRLMMHEFYEQDDVDLLFVGASHFYRGIDPEQLEELTGKSVFLASSSSQTIDASFALIKEAFKQYTPEHIYLNVSSTIALESGEFKDRTSFKQLYLVSDYMKPSLNRLQLILNGSSSKFWINSFFPARRDQTLLFNFTDMAELINTKTDGLYGAYDISLANNTTEWYVGKGYVENHEEVSERLFYSSNYYYTINTDKISDDWRNTLMDIIEYCDSKNVPLTLVEMPLTDYVLAARKNYDTYIAFINELIEGTSVDYVDFNLLNPEYMEYDYTNFKDSDHLNVKGVAKFMPILASYINGTAPDDLFVSSAEEKLAYYEPTIYGVVRTTKTIKKKKYNLLRIVSNDHLAFEFKIEVAPGLELYEAAVTGEVVDEEGEEILPGLEEAEEDEVAADAEEAAEAADAENGAAEEAAAAALIKASEKNQIGSYVIDESDFYLYRDFSIKYHIYLPKGESGVLRITYRRIDDPSVEYVYYRPYTS